MPAPSPVLVKRRFTPVKLPNEPAITPQIVAEHGLSPEEYQRVLAIMGRTPTMVELGIGPSTKAVYCCDGNMGNALGEAFDAA